MKRISPTAPWTALESDAKHALSKGERERASILEAAAKRARLAAPSIIAFTREPTEAERAARLLPGLKITISAPR